ncbi:MAG: PIN domain-containing protein [Selenomonadaceae bacterium]|nr:PIN domain-containing protein [Selenomonadaceae bacterium]
MKVLIDTNVLLDFLAKRQDYFKFANDIINACRLKKITGFVAAHSITNIFYILRKEYSIAERKTMLKHLLNILKVINLDREKILNALENESIDDLEDALQACCAENYTLDYIIARDLMGFPNVSISVISSEEFCNLIAEED